MPGERTLVAVLMAAAGVAAPLAAQSVQYRSPAGVDYRSQPDTGAIARAESALVADPRNIDRIIQLGVAQSGARQFREAIATFSRGLTIEPNNARAWFERSISSGGWPAFGFILSEIELRKLR